MTQDRVPHVVNLSRPFAGASAVCGRLARRIGKGLGVACLAVAIIAPAHAKVDADARHAVVIGNADYGFGPLDNPINDARAITGTLRDLDFRVTKVENVGLADLQRVIDDMAQRLPRDGVGIFYYAGHAVQYQGVNYLLPTDFTPRSAADLPRTSLDMRDVLEAMEAAGSGLNIIILDSCRDYPFGDDDDAFGEGLAQVATSGETLVAYATAAGKVALDGVGPNSPYTAALVSALELPGNDIYDIFRIVRGKVRESTNGKQLPWVSGSIETQLVLHERETQPEIVTDDVTVADVHWNTIKDSTDPADFVEFVESHPQSSFTPVALERREALRNQGYASPGPITVAVDSIVGPGGQVVPVTECDVWASDPHDPRRLAEGIEWGLVNTRQAIRACAEAVADDPDNPRLNYNFGRALDLAERFGEARAFYERAAADNYAAAVMSIGYMHRTARGTPRDYETAATYYLKASLLGHAAARSALGKMYAEGWGVPQSDAEALRWAKLSAADGFPLALDQVGIMYRDGIGVEVDYAKAAEYHRAAAALGWSNALSNLGQLYRDGEGVRRDIDEAIRLFVEATEAGNPYAPYHWGRLLRSGEHVPRDPERALALFELSADRGFEWAFMQIASMYENGELGQRDLAKAYYYWWIARAAGEARRNEGSVELANLANEHLADIRRRLDDTTARRVADQAERWVNQNSLFEMLLISAY